VSYLDYKYARELVEHDVPFYALILAAAVRADPINAARLRGAFPQAVAEAEQRHRSPCGLLASDPPEAKNAALAGAPPLVRRSVLAQLR
jgi:hypothetical protein